jgi:hypothetical protein
MNRPETIEKLIKEGFSEKTLVKFNDNQLKKFADKILKEAQTVTTTKTVYNSKDPKDIAALNTALKNPDALKNQPAEVKEEGKKKTYKSKKKEGQTDEELYNAMSEMGWDYGKYGSDDFDDDGFAEAALNLGYRWSEKTKMWYNRDTNESVKSLNGLKQIKEWVNNVVDKKYHTMTTKLEMVELIKSKMNTIVSEDLTEKRLPKLPEFMSFDSIVSAGKPEEAPVQPEVIPDTPTREKPTREDDPRRRPFRNPNEEPGVDPDPKAKIRKISRPNMSMAAE